MEEHIRVALRKKLSEVGLAENMLTPAELHALQKEITAELNGADIPKGVLSNPEILYRSIGRCDG